MFELEIVKIRPYEKEEENVLHIINYRLRAKNVVHGHIFYKNTLLMSHAIGVICLLQSRNQVV